MLGRFTYIEVHFPLINFKILPYFLQSDILHDNQLIIISPQIFSGREASLLKVLGVQ